jgi:hypothetical protein
MPSYDIYKTKFGEDLEDVGCFENFWQNWMEFEIIMQ